MLRPTALRAYATEAGFSEVQVLPIENEMWRFYRLTGWSTDPEHPLLFSA